VSGGLTRRATAAFGLLALLVGSTFAVLILTLADQRDARNLARNSRAEVSSADRILPIVLDLETGQRGFIITREPRFLEPWNAGRTAFPDEARVLRGLVKDPAQARRARRITELGDSYIKQYSVPLVNAARRNDPSVRSVATTAEGKRRVDALRAEIKRFSDIERNSIAVRQDQVDAAARKAGIVAAGGLGGSLLLVLLIGRYLARAIVRPVRQASVMADRLAEGDLSVRMPETGVGEIGVLQRAFNTMASSLEVGRDDLTASRARVVEAADETRRRIERDLHDGAQQRLVSLGLELRAAQTNVPPDLMELRAQLARATEGLSEIFEQLREISRGIHPVSLARGGLGPALKALAAGSPVPVELDLGACPRLPERAEIAGYYIVSEALTNVAKHAQASVVHVDAGAEDGVLRLSIRDDGVGGVDPGNGSGIVGLTDRIHALGGRIEIESPAAAGTTIRVELPYSEQS
jgi:signal transduction histidine kinase